MGNRGKQSTGTGEGGILFEFEILVPLPLRDILEQFHDCGYLRYWCDVEYIWREVLWVNRTGLHDWFDTLNGRRPGHEAGILPAIMDRNILWIGLTNIQPHRTQPQVLDVFQWVCQIKDGNLFCSLIKPPLGSYQSRIKSSKIHFREPAPEYLAVAAVSVSQTQPGSLSLQYPFSLSSLLIGLSIPCSAPLNCPDAGERSKRNKDTIYTSCWKRISPLWIVSQTREASGSGAAAAAAAVK